MVNEVLSRILKGNLKNLDKLGMHDGRILIENLKLPAPSIIKGKQVAAGNLTFDMVSGTTHIKGIRWSKLHFKNCDLSQLMFSNGEISDCVFEDCNCEGISFWGSDILNSRLERVNLRDSLIQGVHRTILANKPGKLRDVVFARCDLRRSAHTCESYDNCQFLHCNLDAVEFEGAIFTRCKFVGIVADVIFLNKTSDCPKAQLNLMDQCDFTEAELVGCDFYKIDLNRQSFGQNKDYIFMPKGPETWYRFKAQLQPDEQVRSTWFIDQMAERGGTPTMEYRSRMLELFSTEQVAMFERVAASE